MNYLLDETDYKCNFIKKLKLNDNVITEFKDNYINENLWTESYNNLLHTQLNNLFVMIIYINDKNKIKLSKILSPELFDIITINQSLIIGFIIILNATKYVRKNRKIWYIDLIDTRISNQHIGRIMIYKLKIIKKRDFVPLIIATKAIKYWQKYFKIEYGLMTKDDIINYIKINNISNYNNWGILYEEIKN